MYVPDLTYRILPVKMLRKIFKLHRIDWLFKMPSKYLQTNHIGIDEVASLKLFRDEKNMFFNKNTSKALHLKDIFYMTLVNISDDESNYLCPS